MKICTYALIITAVLASTAQSAAAQQSNAELSARQLKDARLLETGSPEPLVRNLVPPSMQTERTPLFGYRLILGAVYEPIAFEDETWIYVGCQSVDPRVAWDRRDHGSLSLVRIHALVYELDRNGDINFDDYISTIDTEESDEAICDLRNGIDTSFVEIPRDFEPAVVQLISVASSRQNAEVVENVERTVTLP